jgi:hypothetical protein
MSLFLSFIVLVFTRNSHIWNSSLVFEIYFYSFVYNLMILNLSGPKEIEIDAKALHINFSKRETLTTLS